MFIDGRKIKFFNYKSFEFISSPVKNMTVLKKKKNRKTTANILELLNNLLFRNTGQGKNISGNLKTAMVWIRTKLQI